jgi:Right handed beta helix region
MKKIIIHIFTVLIVTLPIQTALATAYFFHPKLGNDNNSGKSIQQPFQSLTKIREITLIPGDIIYLAAGEVFNGTLIFESVSGNSNAPIIIDSYNWDSGKKGETATIDAQGFANGILLDNSSFIHVKNLSLRADGPGQLEKTGEMRVGVLIKSNTAKKTESIVLENLNINDIFYEPKGTVRGAEEVKSANGTQKYGWGIRLINSNAKGLMENIKILNCKIENVSHTGIKLTGTSQNIRNIVIKGNRVHRVGGPGIQMSEVRFVHVEENEVKYSGSDDDSRKWGRGSGLWTWGASNVLIEKNKFMYANGPGDSAGAHIDFNCDNVVLQYNFSANNAGGFCEILGNTYNCAYRYNISVNDGHRVKGKNGAFQEGKIFWLSGYQGNDKPKKGPVNSYFYNNTIYVDLTQVSKIAIDNSSKGVLIANNIFYIKDKCETVLGDQYKPDTSTKGTVERVNFVNNVFLRADNWPSNAIIVDQSPIIGNPDFVNPGGLNPQDYTPKNTKLVKSGLRISHLKDDSFGLINGLEIKKDFVGEPINSNPSIGAIQVKLD